MHDLADDDGIRRIQYVRPFLYPCQMPLLGSHRIVVCEASTKVGKTTALLVWLLEKALRRNGGNFWWVAPIFSQSEIAWKRLKTWLHNNDKQKIKLFPTLRKPLSISLPNGSTLFFKSADDPDKLYGDDVHAAVIDEATRTVPDTWTAVRSVITATRGQVRIISNVRGKSNWAYQFARAADRGEMPETMSLRIPATEAFQPYGPLDHLEVQAAQAQLDPATFAELYMCDPKTTAGVVYTQFDKDTHVAKIDPDYDLPLQVSLDWNINPGMYCSLGQQKRNGDLVVLDELFERGAPVPRLAKLLLGWIARHKFRSLELFGDATGQARSVTVGSSNLSVMVQALKERGITPRQRFNRSNPHESDRINAFNAAMLTGNGTVHWRCDAKCSRLIRDLEHVTYDKAGDIDKKTDMSLTHASDAEGYRVAMLRPIEQLILPSANTAGVIVGPSF